MTSRLKAIEALGGRCAKCGYNADSRVLVIANGDGKAERNKFGSREAYYFYVVEHVGDGKYRLLCRNCQFLRMYKAREPAHPKPYLPPLFVWQTDLPLVEALAESRWLDGIEENYAVRIVHPNGVYRYCGGGNVFHGGKVAESWQELMDSGYGPLPKEAAGVVEWNG